MPAKKAAGTEESPAPQIKKLKRLTVRNFRAIGPTPIVIDLDEIVVLVGPNNAGRALSSVRLKWPCLPTRKLVA